MSKELIERLRNEGDGVMSRREKTQIAARIEELERERDAMKADNARLREVMDKLARLGNGNLYGTSDGNRIAQSALATTPEQSLARIRNRVMEECALEADRQFEDEPYGHAKFRCANIALEIRAMKEPE